MAAEPGPMTFGRLVRLHRERLLLTQEDLAARSGLSTRAISYLESGRVRRPRAASVRVLADALELTGADRTEFGRVAAAITTWSPDSDAPRSDADADAEAGGGAETGGDAETGGGAADGALGSPVGRRTGILLAGAGERPVDLPPVARSFVGREEELALLDAVAGPDATASDGSVRIALLSGTAGVGKTALSLRWAHRVAPLFGDGQLFLDLRGFSPVRPMTTSAALGVLIHELDPGADIAPEPAARAAQFRGLASGRRLLIVLDNARSADQVRPLLPGTSSCAVLITSRHDLGGLVARDGAVRVRVSPLPAVAATDLLTALVPEQVASAEPEAVAQLLTRCAHLPLAIRIAAETLAGRADLSVTALSAELADEARRLDLLGVDGDPETGVRDVLSWSYRQLDPAAARAFELLGAQPCADLDLAATAALLKTSADEAARLVGSLTRAHLVERAGTTGRIGLHDLLRAYAQQLADSAELDAATGRLADHLLAVAARCTDLLYPHVRRGAPAIAEVTDAESAAAWLDRERDNLLTLGTHPALADRAVEFSDLLWRYLFTRAFYTEAAHLHEHAMTIAAGRRDRRGEALATRHLAGIRMRLGDYPEALALTDRALELHAETGDDRAVGAAHNLRGVLLERTGRPDEALTAYRLANTLAERTGDGLAIASTLNNIGCLLEHLGRLDEAQDRLERALQVRRRIGDRPGEGLTLGNLAVVHRTAGRYPEAFALYEQAIDTAREVGERNDEAYALDALAGTLRLVGRLEEARTRHGEALAIARATGNKPVEVRALIGLAEVEQDATRFTAALDGCTEALVLARSIGDRHQEARALAAAGRSHVALGDPAAARTALVAAAELYEELGAREAAEVLAELEALG